MLGSSVSKSGGQGFFSKLFGSKSGEGYYEISGLAEDETVNLYRGANSYSPFMSVLKTAIRSIALTPKWMPVAGAVWSIKTYRRGSRRVICSA